MEAANLKPRIRVPKSVKKGETFLVKTLVSHDMETGLRVDKTTGAKIPRNIINHISVTYGEREVMKAVWYPSVSANPFTSFYVKAENSGPMVFTWTNDAGEALSKTVEINVTG